MRFYGVLAGLMFTVSALGAELVIVTPAEEAELLGWAQAILAYKAPGMVSRDEYLRLQQEHGARPKTQAEATVRDYRLKLYREMDGLLSMGRSATGMPLSMRSAETIQRARRDYVKRIAALQKARMELDIVEGRITVQQIEAEIKDAEKEVETAEKDLEAVEKDSKLALNPDRFKEAETPKRQDKLDKAKSKLEEAKKRKQIAEEALKKVKGEDKPKETPQDKPATEF